MHFMQLASTLRISRSLLAFYAFQEVHKPSTQFTKLRYLLCILKSSHESRISRISQVLYAFDEARKFYTHSTKLVNFLCISQSLQAFYAFQRKCMSPSHFQGGNIFYVFPIENVSFSLVSRSMQPYMLTISG